MIEIVPHLTYCIADYAIPLEWVRQQIRLKSQLETAHCIGISPPTVANLLICEGRMRGRTLTALAKAMDIPLNDFCTKFNVSVQPYKNLSQDTEKQFTSLQRQPFPISSPPPHLAVHPSDNIVPVPIFSVAASAGYGVNNDFSTLEIDCHIRFDRGVLRQYTFNIDSLHGLYVQGDSMIPNFYPNDIVIVDPVWKGLRPGVYVIVMREDMLIKRLFRLPKAIQVISDNEAYPSFEVPLSTPENEFKVVSKVVMRLHKI